ncbi:MAG: PQQ-binding-like beta-propeller repeat protein, partial [Verrucomicrobiota bacterium]
MNLKNTIPVGEKQIRVPLLNFPCLGYFFASLVLFSLAASSGAAADWPRFRGPNGDGIATDAKPPTLWSDTKNLKWKSVLPGPGSSSPIVSGGKIFVTCYSGYGDGSAGGSPDKLQRHLICIDQKSGKILWDKSVAAELPEDAFTGFLTEHGYASSTPVTDGERVYVFFGKTGVLAFDLDGKQLWKVNVGKMSSNRRWGSGASLVLYKNVVIVNASEESRSIRALDKSTGKEVWKAEADSLELCFGTPVLVDCGGGRTDVVIGVPGELWGLNPDTGKLRWFAETGIDGNVSPSAVAVDGVVYLTGGFPRQGSVAVRAGGKGDVTKTNLLWSSQNASYVPSPIVQGGNFYLISDQGFATCLEAKTGKLVYKERVSSAGASGPGGKPFYASPVSAGGNFYAVSRRNGTFIIASKNEFSVVSQNKFAGDTSDFNAAPAIVG